MLAEESFIQDATYDSSQGSKILLAERIIESFTPMFSEEIDRNTEGNQARLRKAQRCCKSDK